MSVQIFTRGDWYAFSDLFKHGKRTPKKQSSLIIDLGSQSTKEIKARYYLIIGSPTCETTHGDDTAFGPIACDSLIFNEWIIGLSTSWFRQFSIEQFLSTCTYSDSFDMRKREQGILKLVVCKPRLSNDDTVDHRSNQEGENNVENFT